MFKLGQMWELDLSTYHGGLHQFNVPITFVYSILTKVEKDYFALTLGRKSLWVLLEDAKPSYRIILVVFRPHDL